MRHIISVLMANEAGALVRVAGMFSQRGFNIETLNVAPTDDDSVSRLTLSTTGDSDEVNQINRQLLKLVDVIDVLDLTAGEHVERELTFVKLRNADAINAQAERLGARVHDERDGIATLQFVGTGLEVSEFITAMSGQGELLEVIRSGAVAVTPGERGLRYSAHLI